MGSVFEAEDTSLGHHVALKVLHPHLASNPAAAARFLREGRAAARIRHAHVVQVFAAGTEHGTQYLTMELLDGGDLASLLAARGRLSVSQALDVLLPVTAAVAAAHDAGVIHRDLKPSNICMASASAPWPVPKVVDFGVSKLLEPHGVSDVTISDAVLGTAAYMSPEQARGAANVSAPSDQYSLAVILYQCVTGVLPFSGRSLYEVIESAMTSPLAPPSAHAPAIPPAFDEVVMRAMARDQGARLHSMRELGAQLLPFASARLQLALRAEFLESSEFVTQPSVAAHVTSPSDDVMLHASSVDTTLLHTDTGDARALARRHAGD